MHYEQYYFSNSTHNVKAELGFCLSLYFFTQIINFWNDRENIIVIPIYLHFSLFSCSWCSYEIWLFLPFYFPPLNIVNQAVNTSKTYQFFESFWKTPYCALWIFKLFSISYDSQFSSNGHVQYAACQLFPNSVAQREHCWVNLCLIAASAQAFLNEPCNHTSCTRRLNTHCGSPLVNLSHAHFARRLESPRQCGFVCQSRSVCSL